MPSTGLEFLLDALKKMIVGHSKDMDTDGVYGHEMDGDEQCAVAIIDEAFMRCCNKGGSQC